MHVSLTLWGVKIILWGVKIIWGSVGTFVSKWNVSQKWLAVEQKIVKFGAQLKEHMTVGTFDLVVFKYILVHSVGLSINTPKLEKDWL